METQNDILRYEFEELGLTYKSITEKEIKILKNCIELELSVFDNNGFKMTLCPLRKMDVEYKKDGTLKKCFFMVNGKTRGETPYFKRREAISFNTQGKTGDGFIGFAGWSDSKNVVPFNSAFRVFIHILIKTK